MRKWGACRDRQEFPIHLRLALLLTMDVRCLTERIVDVCLLQRSIPHNIRVIGSGVYYSTKRHSCENAMY